jgi:hypothetical protein
MEKKAESKDTHSNAEEGARDREKAEGGFLGVLRVATLIAALAGGAGSLGLLLHAGRRTPGSFCYFSCFGCCCRARPSYGPTWFRSVGRLLSE